MASLSKTANELIEDVSTIASLPSAYSRLAEVASNPKSSANDFARVINDDPGLTARLLKIVNSSQFGYQGKIETVSRAVVVIGTKQLSELVLATSVVKCFKNIPSDIMTMDSFWRHSVACGLFAKAIGFYRGDINTERYFVAGLLHDIGRMVIFTQLPDEARIMLDECKRTNTLLYMSEKNILGFNHAVLGGMLLEKWNLPAPLQAAVKYHHNPKLAVNHGIEASIVHIADIMANAMQYGSSGEQFVPPLENRAWEILGLDAKLVPFILDEVERVFEDVVQTMLTPQR